jgi:3-hydroxybutyrate dehydrogenase
LFSEAVLTKNVALVTGAASGIGFAISKSLSQKGYSVWLTDLNFEAAEKAASSLEGDVIPFKLDMSSQDDIDAVAKVVREKSGRLDVLVNNAGIQHVAPLEEFPPGLWRKINEILLVGPAMLTRAVLPLMREQNFGRIVNIGSIHALVGSAYKTAYVAAKHGLIGFSKVVALETAEQDITINTICPAYVRTPLVDKQIAEQAKSNGISEEDVINKIMLEPMPKKQFVTLEEICSTVDFLISETAKTMTAQTIVLDGGWTAK